MKRIRSAVAAGSLLSIFGAIVLLFATPGSAAAKCGDLPGDQAGVAATRAAIASQCGCPQDDSRSAFLDCARNVTNTKLLDGSLARSCRSTVLRCVSKSTCGRGGAVTCCRTNKKGKTSCKVVKNAASCKAPSGGSACTGFYSSCCDACTASGCAAAPTPIPTASPTPSPSPSPTPTPPQIPPLPPLPAICQPLVNLPTLATVPLTIGEGTSDCGPPAAPPISGELLDGEGNLLTELGDGCMYVGALPPLTVTPGTVAQLDVKGIGLLSVKLGGSEGNGPLDCTVGAGPGTHCINGEPGTDGAGACTSDVHCGNEKGACNYDANCFFGPPIPIPLGPASVCVVNTFLSDLCGEIDLLTTQATFATAVSARVYLTGNNAAPCPQCLDGVCSRGKRVGQPCTAVGPGMTSPECLPGDGQYTAALQVNIPELTSGTSTLEANAAGQFCTGQPDTGALGFPQARTLVEQGQGLGAGGSLLEMKLAGTFCVPATGTGIDTLAGLPAPGGISQGGSVDLTGILPLPFP